MADHSLYARHEGLGIEQDQCVIIVGCGGIGSWLGYFLGLAGVQRLELFDGDRIEEHNLSRLPFTPKDIGRFKSEALAELINRARPDIEVNAHAHFDPEFEREAMRMATWVAVSTDSHKSRKLVWDAVEHRRTKLGWGIRYLECGADGNSGSVTGAPAEWVTPAEEQPGYQSVPVWVGPCTAVASIASYYILHYAPLIHTHRIDWHDFKERMMEDGRSLPISAYVKLDTFSEGEPETAECRPEPSDAVPGSSQ